MATGVFHANHRILPEQFSSQFKHRQNPAKSLQTSCLFIIQSVAKPEITSEGFNSISDDHFRKVRYSCMLLSWIPIIRVTLAPATIAPYVLPLFKRYAFRATFGFQVKVRVSVRIRVRVGFRVRVKVFFFWPSV